MAKSLLSEHFYAGNQRYLPQPAVSFFRFLYAGSILPENVIHLFVTDISPCTSKVNPGFLPGNGIILTNRFGRKLLFAVFASANLRYRETQPGILTTATDDFSTIQLFTKDGSIAQTSINGLQHLPVIFSQLLLS